MTISSLDLYIGDILLARPNLTNNTDIQNFSFMWAFQVVLVIPLKKKRYIVHKKYISIVV